MYGIISSLSFRCILFCCWDRGGMHMYTVLCVHMYKYTSIWWPEVNIWYLPHGSPLYFWMHRLSLTLKLIDSSRPTSPRGSSASTSLTMRRLRCLFLWLPFYVGAEDPNLAPQDRTASTLLTEPSPSLSCVHKVIHFTYWIQTVVLRDGHVAQWYNACLTCMRSGFSTQHHSEGGNQFPRTDSLGLFFIN